MSALEETRARLGFYIAARAGAELDEEAWYAGVDTWSVAWPDDRKRLVLRELYVMRQLPAWALPQA